MGIDRYDQEMHPRCPPLGGEVPFYHCRRVNRGLPCHRIVLCWADRVDIASFIRENYSQEEIEAMSRPPESRLAVMLETAQRVKKERGR
ncbi:hypothetical protein [Deferrisoma camini]|uniref:hypothetical protein n=1 Tax=Deferrisoma camini TaxID=1035120 RepID=UPI00046D5B06|nr:hypothetical protein [Deferrisoma camini]